MATTDNSATAIRDSLRQIPELEAGLRGRVIKHLIARGHAIDDLPETNHLFAAADSSAMYDAISAVESAKIDRKRIPVLNRIKASLKRWNYPWKDDGIIDMQILDQCFAGKDIGTRLELKAAMKACGLLPRYQRNFS
jgi:hypothetical protein